MPSDPASENSAATGRHEIVVVDDDPFALRMIEALLRAAGHTQLRKCGSVAEALGALDAAGTRKILLICDLNMPEINGVEFLGMLAARSFRGSILICSGAASAVRASAANLAHAYGLRLCGVIEKPLAAKDFAERVRTCLQ